jgi:thioredoxin-dependent peroxiredoxin
LEEFRKLKVAAVGISPDPLPRLKKFDEQHNLGFSLLSDPDHKVAEAYGVWVEKTMYGKKTWGILRSAFLLNEEGKITNAWYKVSPGETVPRAISVLKETES